MIIECIALAVKANMSTWLIVHFLCYFDNFSMVQVCFCHCNQKGKFCNGLRIIAEVGSNLVLSTSGLSGRQPPQSMRGASLTRSIGTCIGSFVKATDLRGIILFPPPDRLQIRVEE